MRLGDLHKVSQLMMEPRFEFSLFGSIVHHYTTAAFQSKVDHSFCTHEKIENFLQ